MKRLFPMAAAIAFMATSCSGTSADISGVPDLPEATTEGVVGSIQGASQPAVVNVWASWCGPCRSEAPLLSAAASEFSDRVTFVGLNVRDSQDGAKGFIVDFLKGAPIEHVYDRDGSTVADLGGTSGVPLTFFMRADGSVSKVHFGVIDERTLALELDELLEAGA